MTGPPPLASKLIGLALPARDRAAVLGDLTEEYFDRSAELGAAAARRWFWWQALTSIPSALSLRARAAGVPKTAYIRRQRGMAALMQDVRFGWRGIRKNPGFSLLVTVTLGLGIAANTVVFSVVDGVVLNPFPFPEPRRLVGVGSEYPKTGQELTFWENLSPAEYVDIRESSRTLRDVVAWDMGNRQVTFGDETENVFSAFWWGDAFPTLGVQPRLGRGFLAEEIERGDRVAVLSHRLWSTRFGADPGLIGGQVLVNGEPYAVVGIMPPRTLIYGTDLWLPMPVGPQVYPRDRRQFQLLARLAPGVTLEQANAELRVIAQRTEQEHGAEFPEYAGWGLSAMIWTDINVRMLRPAALILTGAVGFVLLLVCANVANLLLARATRRRREFAVRAALGAGSGRLVQQLLTESVVLAIAGAALGIALGYLGVRGVLSLLPSVGTPIPGEIAVNARVVATSVAIALGAGVLVGLLPAWRARRFGLQRTLQDESLGTTGGTKQKLQRVFVVAEVALAIILLTGGGLLIHSFLRLQAVDPGFEPRDVLTMRLTLPFERYSEERIDPFFRELVRRVEEIPGVKRAATATQFPPAVFLQSRFYIEGGELSADGVLPAAYTTLASPGFFETLALPLVRGRSFDERDTRESSRVAVVNEAAASRFFPGQDPIARRFKLGAADGDAPWFQIVGVVGSAHNRGLDLPAAPELFASAAQGGGGNQFFLLVRTSVDPRSVLPAIRAAVATLDPQQPVYAIRTVDEAFAASAATRRVSTLLLTIFAVFALVLSAVGVYAVVSYAVGQRTREIGVRMALGAGRGEVRRLVVRQAMLPVLFGLLIGLGGAIAVGRAMTSLLFEVNASDPATLLSVAAILLGSASAASYIPARRASGLDPLSALRHDRQGL